MIVHDVWKPVDTNAVINIIVNRRKSEKGLDGINELTMSHQRHPWMIQNGYF